MIGHLLASPVLRETIGGLAREHVRLRHGLDAVTRELALFLGDVQKRKAALLAAVAEEDVSDDSLLTYFTEEVRASARDLGLVAVPLGLDALLGSLGGASPPRARK
jgi:hypothetical protein